jgi:uncharacterized protein YdeI (YjbR/CyaY-like superfamily)
LYEPLSEFLTAEQFPAGPIEMKQFRLKDASALAFFGAQSSYKIEKIEKILADFPYLAEKTNEITRPILERLREWVHEGCPEVEETIKWSSPAFEHQGLLGVMAGFKAHAAFGFWKGKLFDDPDGVLQPEGFGGSGTLKLESVDDLPEKEVVLGFVRQAVELNERGVAVPTAGRGKKREEVVVPDDLRAALDAHPAARETFEGFSYSHRKEYVEWITEAKRDATRAKRIAQAVEWMAEGKSRNWKYM